MLFPVILIFFYLIFIIIKRKRVFMAKKKFREKILLELEGIYPVSGYWNEDQCWQVRDSSAKVEAAAAEFRQYIASGKRYYFDTAVKQYINNSNAMTWAACAVLKGKGPSKEGPRELFRQHVNNLLSFTVF